MIRQGQRDDYDSIDAFDPFAGDRKAELASGNCLVSVEDHKVVAYVTFALDGFNGRPFISYLTVSPKRRRCGIATSLLSAVEKSIGSGRIFISTEETNQAMQALLKKLSWIAAGVIQGANTDGSSELFYFRDA